MKTVYRTVQGSASDLVASLSAALLSPFPQMDLPVSITPEHPPEWEHKLPAPAADSVWHWVVTGPNPRSRDDAEPRGWKLHAVRAPEDGKFSEIARLPAACGLRARHGWGGDLFIEKKCVKCLRATGIACSECLGKGSTGSTLLGTWRLCRTCHGNGEKKP